MMDSMPRERPPGGVATRFTITQGVAPTALSLACLLTLTSALIRPHCSVDRGCELAELTTPLLVALSFPLSAAPSATPHTPVGSFVVRPPPPRRQRKRERVSARERDDGCERMENNVVGAKHNTAHTTGRSGRAHHAQHS
uniref:Uncharacterized protein n=1 Tax=Anopheles farauti TaxID=69004 RepID=A0A182QL38_9DIPT